MKLFKIFLSLFLIVITIVVISRFFPHTYKVERSIEVNKPVSEVFAYMSNLHNWEEWSLWNKSVDSTLYYFYNQKHDTIGARQYIRGELVGRGFFEITSYKKDSTLGFFLNVGDSERTAAGTFFFKPLNANATVLYWTDSGDVGGNVIKRFMIPFVTKNTETTLDNGLQSIKKHIEN